MWRGRADVDFWSEDVEAQLIKGRTMEADEQINEFEVIWAGKPGAVNNFLKAEPDLSMWAQLEIVKIDMELQWRRGTAVETNSNEYEAVVAELESDQIAELYAWEFAVRNDWGDCVSRQTVESRNKAISPQVQREIELVSADVSWPCVRLWKKQEVLHALRLDRRIQCGRRPKPDSPSVESNFYCHRINLAEMHDLSLSRHQLDMERASTTHVCISNPSRKRAVAIESYGALDAGESATIPLPAFVILSEQLSVAVTTR